MNDFVITFHVMYGEPIILASESPRRSSILESLHIPFQKIVPSIDESIFDHLEPGERVTALAATKARRGKTLWLEKQENTRQNEIQDERPSATPRLVLGADTLVAFQTQGGWITIGKPANERDAFDMLSMEAGKRHTVFSGLCLLDMTRDQPYVALSVSEVQFSPMTNEDIAWYLSFGEWRGAAGAYRIQGVGSYFIEEIKGSSSSVMGLPIHELYGILRESGYFASP
ncbi:MAG: Maf family protein [Rectinema sp.]